MPSLLLSSIRSFFSIHPDHSSIVERFTILIDQYGDAAYDNQHWGGHITASMLITNPEKTKVLLMFHRKLQKWLQFGGHSDGDTDTIATAIREFHEESGISREPIVHPDIFDIDIHHIPADLK
jgi:8-oxo-dGTP pyrophosphatase MutT (NUDIX family)